MRLFHEDIEGVASLEDRVRLQLGKLHSHNYPLLCLIPQMKARPCPGLTEGRLAILLDVQDGWDVGQCDHRDVRELGHSE